MENMNRIHEFIMSMCGSVFIVSMCGSVVDDACTNSL